MIMTKALTCVAGVLVTFAMCNVVGGLEAQANDIAKKTGLHGYSAQEHGVQSEDSKALDRQLVVLRDNIRMLWVVGGAFLGGFIIVGFRTLAGPKMIARYFGVSVGLSMGTTPYLLVAYLKDERPEVGFFWAMVLALSAWVILEIFQILGSRAKDAAVKRGWIGLKDELASLATGLPTPQQLTPVPAPPLPPAK
jgi:hypothetical protein